MSDPTSTSHPDLAEALGVTPEALRAIRKKFLTQGDFHGEKPVIYTPAGVEKIREALKIHAALNSPGLQKNGGKTVGKISAPVGGTLELAGAGLASPRGSVEAGASGLEGTGRTQPALSETTPPWGTLTVVRPMGNARFVLCEAEADGAGKKARVELMVRSNAHFVAGMIVEPRRYVASTVREDLARLVGKEPRHRGRW